MTPIEELLSVADDAEQAKAELLDKSIQEPLDALRKASNEAARAWSGSNIGYHATIYYRGLQPTPSDVQFSAEWGLLERWPTHEPDHGWETMDHQAVMDVILTRAGIVDSSSISKAIRAIRVRFLTLKDNALSILSAKISTAPDKFLEAKSQQIEGLNAPSEQTIAHGMLPNQYWSRDSLAMTQGLRIAPHQILIAIPTSADSLEPAIDTLAKATRLSAVHIQRIAQGRQSVKNNGQTIFVGHGQSPIWREFKEFLTERLQLSVEEFNSVSAAGIPTVDRLSAMLDSASFAFLIMTGEDEQPDGRIRARLNVIHEAGLFQGRLGFNRAIIVLEDGCEEFSNISGLGQIRFAKGKVGSCFEEVRRVLEREKLIE